VLEQLKAEVCKANLDLVAKGLVIETWGNASGARRSSLLAFSPDLT
jgi:L-ribulose-5-phosphate 4-epimerase